jgi:NADPH:quinone reductase-like Zn-dependent oxidoreductase
MKPTAAACGGFRLFAIAMLVLGLGLGGFAVSPSVGPDDAGRIAGKTYVVTGASSGFGRGVAQRLGGLGANVVLAARRPGLLEEVADEVRSAGGEDIPVADHARMVEVNLNGVYAATKAGAMAAHPGNS